MRTLCLAVVFVLVAGGCSRGAGDQAPKFAAPQRVAAATGVEAMAVDGTTLYYGVVDTGDIHRVDAVHPGTPERIGHVVVRSAGANGLVGLAVRGHALFVAYVQPDRHLVVATLERGVVWTGPLTNSLHHDGHVAFDDGGHLVISFHSQLLQVGSGEGSTVVSDGWVSPFAFDIDAHNRLFVADQPPLHGRALVAHGRDRAAARRRRGAELFRGSKPSGLAVLGDDLLVCRGGQGDVFRVHVAASGTLKRRAALPDVKCRSAIVALSDGSIVTAVAHEIRRYPRR
ncbi:MAG TPA: hypothetical protein VHD87_14595 [Acidimicrobiales bacterium]|nr:hypothetical protein [Acidimicrobiales bacterium]